MPGFSQSDDALRSKRPPQTAADADSPAAEIIPNSREQSILEEPELDAALQLLVERAQYITGATGTALALPQAEEMVCRASAGTCAPAIGARLQVQHGLTGESITRRQLLRCDNAETDPRVNLEACRALGIASIVVLPLLRRDGEVRGLFELFSDHPYAFEERDLIALERMADLTLTALDLAEQRHGTIPLSPPVPPQPEKSAQPAPLDENKAHSAAAAATNVAPAKSAPAVAPAIVVKPTEPPSAAPSALRSAEPFQRNENLPAPSRHEPALHVPKCASCGFPVSEGRMLCLDCEEYDRKATEARKQQVDRLHRESAAEETKIHEDEVAPLAEPSSAQTPEEIIPAFLANAVPVKESWLANHVNLIAILVLILGILVAIVVFR
jgi:putative methionine-R-sulfoxide reductase with GAF domain